MVVLKETKGSVGSTFNDLKEQLECYALSSGKMKYSDRVRFTPEVELADLKREFVLGNFFYLGLRLRFEGFDEDFK